MGRRGPRPTPTAILKNRGSRRAKSRKREPQPDPAAPPCPAWLTDDARDCWNELLPQLVAMGVLTRIDGNALARYCRLWARWRALERTIELHGEIDTIYTQHGSYEQQRPEVGIANKLMAQLLRLEQEFGMTPASRPRLAASEPLEEKSSGLAAFNESA